MEKRQRTPGFFSGSLQFSIVKTLQFSIDIDSMGLSRGSLTNQGTDSLIFVKLLTYKISDTHFAPHTSPKSKTRVSGQRTDRGPTIPIGKQSQEVSRDETGLPHTTTTTTFLHTIRYTTHSRLISPVSGREGP